MKEKRNLTLLIPAYNEEGLLENAVKYYHSHLKKLKNLESFEIIICVNGSTDNTEKIAKELSKKYKEVKYLATIRKGMGIAIKLGILKANKNLITYMPGDGEIGANFIENALKSIDKYDFIIGRREKPDYKASLLRKIMTYGFNATLAIMLSSKVAEAASVKMFKTRWAKKVARKFENDGFAWQIEFVYYALRDKLNIGFATAHVLDKKKESSVRPFRTAWNLLKASLKYGLRYRLRSL